MIEHSLKIISLFYRSDSFLTMQNYLVTYSFSKLDTMFVCYCTRNCMLFGYSER